MNNNEYYSIVYVSIHHLQSKVCAWMIWILKNVSAMFTIGEVENIQTIKEFINNVGKSAVSSASFPPYTMRAFETESLSTCKF